VFSHGPRRTCGKALSSCRRSLQIGAQFGGNFVHHVISFSGHLGSASPVNSLEKVPRFITDVMLVKTNGMHTPAGSAYVVEACLPSTNVLAPICVMVPHSRKLQRYVRYLTRRGVDWVLGPRDSPGSEERTQEICYCMFWGTARLGHPEIVAWVVNCELTSTSLQTKPLQTVKPRITKLVKASTFAQNISHYLHPHDLPYAPLVPSPQPISRTPSKAPYFSFIGITKRTPSNTLNQI
jgi:hypothetical protein